MRRRAKRFGGLAPCRRQAPADHQSFLQMEKPQVILHKMILLR
ncbi:hypothetical protein DA2_0442 [Desulfovibrio sp. A2]|nr:hypothetical protein DA2_0442 [Desulfovibrio sp. A2]